MHAGTRRALSVTVLALAPAMGCGGKALTSRGGDGGSAGNTSPRGDSGGSGGQARGGDGGGSSGDKGTGAGDASAGGSSGFGGRGAGGSATGGVPSAGGAPSDGGDPSSVCAPIAERGTPIAPGILVLLDESTSMSCAVPGGTDRWTAVKKGLSTFMMQPGEQDTGIGIQYFGLGGAGGASSSCDARDYASVDVEIVPLPQNAQHVVDSLARHDPNSNTPTAAALAGTINHAVDWKSARLGRSVVVVLVTDGQPDACGAVADVVSTAAAGLANGIPTYVVGLNSPATTCAMDPNPLVQMDLDAIAQAGAAHAAFLIDFAKNPEKGLVDALNEVQGAADPPCRYEIPTPPVGYDLDLTKLNVAYIAAGFVQTTVPNVAPSSCDPSLGGWYFDDPSSPTQIVLCPATCGTVASQPGRELVILIGCPTKIL